MPSQPTRITSASNEKYKDLLGLWSAKGIRQSGLGLVCGAKLVAEVLRQHHEPCQMLIVTEGQALPCGTADLPATRLSDGLFSDLDQLGTKSPLLVVRIPEIRDFSVQALQGPAIILPLQNPDNVGAAIRSAVAFGVRDIVLTDETAHPCLPRSMRASSGAVMACRFWRHRGPIESLQLPHDRSFGLDADGMALEQVTWPNQPFFVVGVEGRGLGSIQKQLQCISIPMEPEMESLNATVALSLVLHQWYRARRE